MKNEPKIRIKGFEGEWKELSFNNLFSLVSDYKSNIGNKTDYQEEGKYPIIDQSKEYIVGYTNEDNPIIPDNGIIVFGDHTREIKYIDFPFYTGADGTKLLHCQQSVFPLFGYYSCCSQRIPNTGYNRHYKFLKEADYIIPSLPEQRTIATYFRHIDSLIETADKKIASLKQVKEASLQSMFPKEGQKVPEVRFKGFEGEWKTSKLSTFAKRVTRKNGNLETELPVTISSQDGIIAQTQFFNNVVASSNLRGYYLIKKGEFAYNKSYSNGYPYGSVKRLEKYDMGALSTLYIVFALSKDIDHDYVIYFFETMLWHNEVAMRAAEGARNHGLLNIGADDFLDIQTIVPPTLSEQRKIASFFVHLDKQIAIAQQRLDLLRRIKSACLDEMFV